MFGLTMSRRWSETAKDEYQLWLMYSANILFIVCLCSYSIIDIGHLIEFSDWQTPAMGSQTTCQCSNCLFPSSFTEMSREHWLWMYICRLKTGTMDVARFSKTSLIDHPHRSTTPLCWFLHWWFSPKKVDLRSDAHNELGDGLSSCIIRQILTN